jgi:hypothetical protein
MYASAPNFDGVCLPLKRLANVPEHPLRRPLRAFMNKLNKALEGRVALEEATDPLHAELYALRLKALEWLAAQKRPDLLGKLEALEMDLLAKATDPGKALLVDNMRFAIEVQREFIAGLSRFGQPFERDLEEHLSGLRNMSLDQLMTAYAALPNPEAARILVRWLTASLRTEAALLMGDAVLNEEVRISRARQRQLNGMLVHAAQEFGAGAQIMGLIPTVSVEQPFLAAEPLPKGWVKEQKQLADLDLSTWFKRA